MREVARWAIVMLLIVLLAGCSASRRRRSTEPIATDAAANYNAVATVVTGYNITDRGFVIRRGRIEMAGASMEGTFGFTARINMKGDFIASVRGPLGIELVRLLGVGNEIAAIDRFNRTVYIGEKDEFLRKNGLPDDFIKILFGDMPVMYGAQYEPVNRNEILVRVRENDTVREVSLCIDEMKVCRQKIESALSGHELSMQFSDFKSDGGMKYASLIEMNEKKSKLHVTVKIDELVTGYDETIEFNLPPYSRSSI